MKRYLFSIAAILIAVAATAFSLKKGENLHRSIENTIRPNETYILNEIWEYNDGHPLDPNSYERGFWQPSCIGVGAVCYIIAEEDIFNPGHPHISPRLQQEIIIALEYCVNTNNVKLKFE